MEPPPYFPNDYVTIPVQSPSDYTTFDVNDYEYINTTKAWGISGGGDPSIIIGISDGKIEDEDIELDGKVSFPNGDPYESLSPYATCNLVATHGTGSAVTAAGKANNNYGTLGVCYDCSINGDDYNFPALLRLAESGAKVINASWTNSGGSLAPKDYIKSNTNRAANYNIIREIVEDYGAIIVASAGNSMQYDALGQPITQYNYPASFDEVISVSSVNHWYELDNHPLTPWTTCNPPDQALFRIKDILVSGLIVSTDPPELITYTCPNGASGAPGPMAGPPHVINDQVDIVTPNYQVINYPKMVYGACPGESSSKYAWGTSHGAPLVSGTVGLMLSLDECLDYLEVDDILKLTSKSIETISYNSNYMGLAGAGAMQTGDAVSFVYQMNQTDGDAVIENQVFNRFVFDIQRIKNDLTINNVQFLNDNRSDFNAENSITITNTYIKPNVNGSFYVGIEPVPANPCNGGPSNRQQSTIIDKADARELNLEIYPNPTNDVITIESEENIISCEVYNILGKSLLKQDFESNTQVEMNLDGLSKNMYFLSVTLENGQVITKKVLKN